MEFRARRSCGMNVTRAVFYDLIVLICPSNAQRGRCRALRGNRRIDDVDRTKALGGVLDGQVSIDRAAEIDVADSDGVSTATRVRAALCRLVACCGSEKRGTAQRYN